MTNFVFEMRQTELLFSSDLNVYFNINMDWAVVAHAFNPSNWRQRQADLCEFEASLGYRVSSRTAMAVTQRNSVSPIHHTLPPDPNNNNKRKK